MGSRLVRSKFARGGGRESDKGSVCGAQYQHGPGAFLLVTWGFSVKNSSVMSHKYDCISGLLLVGCRLCQQLYRLK